MTISSCKSVQCLSSYIQTQPFPFDLDIFLHLLTPFLFPFPIPHSLLDTLLLPSRPFIIPFWFSSQPFILFPNPSLPPTVPSLPSFSLPSHQCSVLTSFQSNDQCSCLIHTYTGQGLSSHPCSLIFFLLTAILWSSSSSSSLRVVLWENRRVNKMISHTSVSSRLLWLLLLIMLY